MRYFTRTLLTSAALFLLAPCLTGTASAREVTSIATGNIGGSYYPYGQALVKLWQPVMPDKTLTAEVTGGSVTNLLKLVHGESIAALAQGDALLDAVEGKGRFLHPLKVSVLFMALPSVVHLLTREGSDIRTMSDLHDHKVAIGAPGSGNTISVDNMLSAIGMTRQDYRPVMMNFADTAHALEKHRIDAGFIIAAVGIPVISELAERIPLRILPFGDGEMASLLANGKGAYHAYTIPAGTYKGNKAPITTPVIWSYLVVDKSMDEALAYKLTYAALHEVHKLRKLTPYAGATDAEATLKLVDSRLLHPGAARAIADVLK